MFLEVLTIGAFSALFSLILTKEIFSFYGRLLGRLIDNDFEWLAKPLGYCAKCLAGQLGLWYYLIKYFNTYFIIDHFCFVTWSILFGIAFEFLINKTQWN